MTAVRPEGGGADGGRTEDPLAAPGAYERAVDALSDPLTDPLPDQYAAREDAQYEPYHPLPYDQGISGPYGEDQGWYEQGGAGDGSGSSGAGSGDVPGSGDVTPGEPEEYGGYQPAGEQPRHDQGYAAPGHSDAAYPGPGAPAEPYGADAYAAGPYAADPYPADAYGAAPYGAEQFTADPYDPHAPAGGPDGPPGGPQTMDLRRADGLTEELEPVAAAIGDTGDAGDTEDAEGTATSTAPAGAGQGRVARRKAEKARKATRANKIANVFGELMITTGVLLMLFVTYQLWWTNVEARAHADRQARELLQEWEDNAGAEEPAADDPAVPLTPPEDIDTGSEFALLYLPTLDVRVPVAEGVDQKAVLDKGLVGRYAEKDGLPTAMPWDEEGNVGLAGHRNTHGEPFRYINRLDEGDPIILETESAYYVYEMRTRLDSTSPSNIQVLDPVPDQGGFTEPGRYITLTTCTPEFSSTYRLIVWGEMVEERPRSEGVPDALAG